MNLQETQHIYVQQKLKTHLNIQLVMLVKTYRQQFCIHCVHERVHAGHYFRLLFNTKWMVACRGI